MGDGEVKTVKSMVDFQKYIGMKRLAVVDHYAKWCNPCKYISPYFKDLAAVYPDVNFVKVDVDFQPDVAESCGIATMPTFQAYKGGNLLEEFSGANKRKLRAMIENHR